MLQPSVAITAPMAAVADIHQHYSSVTCSSVVCSYARYASAFPDCARLTCLSVRTPCTFSQYEYGVPVVTKHCRQRTCHPSHPLAEHPLQGSHLMVHHRALPYPPPSLCVPSAIDAPVLRTRRVLRLSSRRKRSRKRTRGRGTPPTIKRRFSKGNRYDGIRASAFAYKTLYYCCRGFHQTLSIMSFGEHPRSVDAKRKILTSSCR